MSVIKSILYSIHDSAMILAPRGFNSLDMHLKDKKLSHLESKGTQSKEPLAKPQLNINLQNEARHLSEAIGALLIELKNNNKNINPEILRFERRGEVLNVQFLMAGRPVWFSRIENTELATLLVTEELFSTLSGTERAFHELQGQLQTRLGNVNDFNFNASTGELSLVSSGKTAVIKAQLVGQYLTDDFTWVWGWSDSETPRACVEKVESVCAPQFQPQGLAAFWRPSFHCDEGFAWATASSVAVSIGSRGLFRGSVGGAAVVFAPMTWP
jgi:hypothetical protein